MEGRNLGRFHCINDVDVYSEGERCPTKGTHSIAYTLHQQWEVPRFKNIWDANAWTDTSKQSLKI